DEVADLEPLLADGDEAADGDEGEATSEDDNLTEGQRYQRNRTLKVRMTDIEVDYPHSDERPYLLPGDPVTVRVDYEASEPIADKDLTFGLAIHDVEGRLVFGSNTSFEHVSLGRIDGPGRL